MDLDEVVETLEQGEHAPPRLKVVVTLLIVAVTALTATLGYLAVRTDSDAGRANRDHQLWAVEAQREAARVAAAVASADELTIDALEFSTRSTVLSRQAATLEEQGSSAAAGVAAESERWSDRYDGFVEENPGSDPAWYASNVRLVNAAEQQALLNGRLAQAWSGKQDTYVAVIGVLAVSVFLLGLTFTVPGRRLPWMFVVVATVLAAAGGLRAAAAHATSLPELSPSTIAAYLDGREHVDKGEVEQAVAAFTQAVTVAPDYADAWVALGDVFAGNDADDASHRKAIAAYRMAIQAGDRSAVTSNNLAYEQVLIRQPDDAARDFAPAIAAQPNDPFVLATKAEIELAQGNLEAALATRGKLLGIVAELDTHYRNDFLSTFRQDRAALERSGAVSPDNLRAFFDPLKEAEASIDAYGTPQPADLHGASLSNLELEYDDENYRLMVSFDYSGHLPDDRLSVRVYDETPAFVADSSVTRGTWEGEDSGTLTTDAPLDDGTYHVEIYLNGHFMMEGEVTTSSS